jgi:glucosamine-6-phosphate deaminase
VHIPDGAGDNVEEHCDWYEARIKEFGGIDLQILGIGVNGHIGFNEPGSSLGSRTRIKTLKKATRRNNARFFGGLEQVPKHAITMGIGTIMETRGVLLLASGPEKAEAIKATVEGPITAQCPATIVQMHRFATIVADRKAAADLQGEYS